MKRLFGQVKIAAIVWFVVACSHSGRDLGLPANEAGDPAIPDSPSDATFFGFSPRFAGPVLTADASQSDKGSLVDWQMRRACHGDRGQGHTDEWRDAWGEDKNCWASKCHAANHPPQGFRLPKTVPGLLGPGTMGRFSDARDLYEYTSTTMPWWRPGSLTQERALNVTAHLIPERKAVPPNTNLQVANLEASQPQGELRDRSYEKIVVLGAVILLSAPGTGAALRRRAGG